MNEQAKTIKKLLIDAGILQNEFCKKAGLTAPYINYVVNFKLISGPGVEKIRKTIHNELKRKLKDSCPSYDELWGSGKDEAVNG